MAKQETTDASEEAERALFQVRKKLNPEMSVECQVSQLISTAMNPENLCRMYPGWAPWL
jgi:ataxia telangiectasia mutated family protein